MAYKDLEKKKATIAAWREKNKDKLAERGRTPERKAYCAAYQKANRKKSNENKQRWKQRNPEKVLWQHAKARANKKGIDFSIEISDIIIPEICPVLRLSLSPTPYHERRKHFVPPNTPTLDRIDNTKGYVKGNVWVISWRANHIKNNATLEELEMIVAALKSKLPSSK